MVEERTGSCVICQTRDPLPELVPVCGPCRSRVRNQLREIVEFYVELAAPPETPPARRSEDLRYPPGHDDEGKLVPLAPEQLPAGTVPGQSNAPRVAGSREAPMPISADRHDLLSGARVLHLTSRYPEQIEDQVGQLPAAAVLDGWCRDFAEGRRESVPQPFVTTQVRYLTDRLDWAFAEHPAVDEMAREIGDLHAALRRATGRTVPPPEVCWGVECRNADCNYTNTLVRIAGSQWIECTECGLLLSEDEYADWCRLLVAAARQQRPTG